MLNIGPGEIVIIALVLLIAVGPEQLPGLIRRIGQSVSQVRGMTESLRSEFMSGMEEIERVTDPNAWAASAGPSHVSPQTKAKKPPTDDEQDPADSEADQDHDVDAEDTIADGPMDAAADTDDTIADGPMDAAADTDDPTNDGPMDAAADADDTIADGPMDAAADADDTIADGPMDAAAPSSDGPRTDGPTDGAPSIDGPTDAGAPSSHDPIAPSGGAGADPATETDLVDDGSVDSGVEQSPADRNTGSRRPRASSDEEPRPTEPAAEPTTGTWSVIETPIDGLTPAVSADDAPRAEVDLSAPAGDPIGNGGSDRASEAVDPGNGRHPDRADRPDGSNGAGGVGPVDGDGTARREEPA